MIKCTPVSSCCLQQLVPDAPHPWMDDGVKTFFNQQETVYMKRHSHPASLALIAAAGIPMLIATNALASAASHIDLTFIDGLPDTGDYMIGLTGTNYLVALLAAEDGATVTTIGAAFYGDDDGLVFALSELAQGDDGLSLNYVKSGGVLMLSEVRALKLDPRIVAINLMKADGGEYLGVMTAKNEGHAMVFGNEAQIGEGTLVELTKFVLAKKTFIIAENKTTGIILAMEATKSGTTWISSGAIGHLDGGTMEDVAVSVLSAFGIGIPTASTRVGHDPAQRVAA